VMGHEIQSCGIGYGSNEDDARSKAFDSAKNEFDRICKASSECAGKSVTVTPQRTSCDLDKSKKFKCYRMIVFTTGAPIEPGSAAAKAADAEADKHNKVLLHVGLTRAQVKVLLGQPDTIMPRYDLDGPDAGVMISDYTYDYKFFCKDSGFCGVRFNRHGKVSGWSDFDSYYTTDP
jgi:hypothetical protein